MTPPQGSESSGERKIASQSGGSSMASLRPEGTSVGGVSGSVSPMSSNSASSAPFPGNITSILQQVQQSNPSQALNTPPGLSADDTQRAELLKAQLAVIGKMAMAQAAADQQKAAILAQSGLTIPSALQQQAALNSVLLSSTLAAQALAPFQVRPGGIAGQPLTSSILSPPVNPLASLGLPQTNLNPLANTMSNGGVFSSTVAPQFPQLITTTPSIHKIPYRDASLIPDPVVQTNKTSKAEPFPVKIHRMLSELEEQGLRDIASFLPHGRAFVIHKPQQFTDEIMPKYFRMSRFSSFQRQLNLYDFKRITEGKDKGAYYHELFLHGRPALATQMRRTKIKGNAPFAGYQNQNVDFYKMNPVVKNPPVAKQQPQEEEKMPTSHQRPTADIATAISKSRATIHEQQEKEQEQAEQQQPAQSQEQAEPQEQEKQSVDTSNTFISISG